MGKILNTALLMVIVCLCAILTVPSATQTAPSQNAGLVTNHALGPFDVKMTPQDDKNDTGLGRMTFDKQFHGDLEATSKGQMLAAGNGAKGSSGAYVALERVTGTLKGRSGSFALVHTGIMTRGTPQLTITVVPDSGTGQLAGIAGKMTINIAADGKHSYDLEYTLPSTN
jgi:hypothetical protein